MSKYILGIDLGTNSIGWAIREVNNRLKNQIIKKGVLLFDKGVASEKGNEFPKVQKRTESRSKRRNYQAEKYRKWELLEFLITNNMCPLTIEELDDWRKYTKGKRRKYPQNPKFIEWLRFDFNGDGKPDFHLFNKGKHESYYIFREKSVSENVKDLAVFKNNLQILGRVFYQLVQRRGFKGRDEEEAKTMLKGSEKTGTAGRDAIKDYIEKHKVLGAALYHYQKENGGRIRQRYNLRSDYEAELLEICKVHNISKEHTKLLQKSIIWQRPLRSQKGLVGICTYEKNKRRVAVSHPLYQEYRVWVFINNLKISPPKGVELLDYLHNIIYPLFVRKSDFEVSHIQKQLEKDGATMKAKFKPKDKVVALSNFYDFREIFGEKWKEDYNFDSQINFRKAVSKKKITKGQNYTIEDIWHILQTFDSQEKLQEFATKKLNVSNDNAVKFSKIKLNSGYASLSLSAVKKILPYLKQGIKYSTAVYLANLYKVIGSNTISEDLIDYFIEEINEIESSINDRKTLNYCVNSLIKSHIEDDNRYFIEDGRGLDNEEAALVLNKLQESFGTKTWSAFSNETKLEYQKFVEKYFREFLQKHISDKFNIYLKQPRLHQEVFNVLQEKYNLPKDNIKYLWHPSEQETYKNAKEHYGVEDGSKTFYLTENRLQSYLAKNPQAEYNGIALKLLGDPEPISKGFKNPMALKTLHKLKQLLNYLLTTNQIDEHTKIVIEIARELNDNNKRAAIRTYQKQREKENESNRKLIDEINKECETDFDRNDKTLLKKLWLWKEQSKVCLYTGETINTCDLFNGNLFDLEHTIPASMSFDSELKNLTLVSTNFNRYIKGKQIPTQLANYKEDAIVKGKCYSAIEPRLKFIKNKIDKLTSDIKDNVRKTKYISDKSAKDNSIQKRHVLKFELDYWKKKWQTFTIEEYKPQWKNSQLRDTQIVTKYALPYLKTVFKNVSVEKGVVVDYFKEIFDVKLDEKKDRTKHSHHAIDAAILTLIPSSYHREQILKAYFLKQEEKQKYHTKPREWSDFSASYIISIENEVLANNLEDDKILTKTFKKVRRRGKVVKDKNRKVLWAKGDSIRGQLHKESFYGAIKQPKRDENNAILFNDNNYMLLEDSIKLVIRRPLVYKMNATSPGFKKLDEIEKVIVDKALFNQIKKQVEESDFKTKMQEGIYMLDTKGNKVNKIRNIRCYVSLKHETAIEIHEHAFSSSKDYKHYTYSQNEELPYCLYYEGEIKGKLERGINIISLYELSKLKINTSNDLKTIPYYNSIVVKKEKIPLIKVLKTGDKFIFYKENKEELKDLSKSELLSRLYLAYQFEADGRIKFKHHLLAGDMTEAKKIYSEKSKLSFEEYEPLLRISKTHWNFALENIDFSIDIDGTINWLI